MASVLKFFRRYLCEDVLVGSQTKQNLNSIPLVDIYDRIIGSKSKCATHTLNNFGSCDLHRAFSVFLFDSKNRLLLQRRSSYKPIFPLYLTNTCCSHPLFNEDECIEEKAIGIKIASIRRLKFELGIRDTIKLDELKIVTRMRYLARYNEIYGENEIDYCLLIKKDVTLAPNLGEVDELIYITSNDLRNIVSCPKLTPWFKYISCNLLPMWWENLDNILSRKDDQLPQIINAGDISAFPV
ncbi:hypothetical protein HZS_2698 [Henneguya salminicola]|nr:hypothetical protein HZS_2698 [Henneguya salminicola]